jgi:hypothetical protein
MLWTLALGCTGIITLLPDDPVSETNDLVVCADSVPPGLTVSPSWAEPLDAYGEFGGIHAFSPDGAQLVTSTDVYSPFLATFDTANGAGEVLGEGFYPWARDEDWAYEVRGSDWDTGAVVDLRTGEVVLDGEQLGEAWRGGHSVISGDGRTLAAVDCSAGALTARAWAIPSGEPLTEMTLPGVGCYGPPSPSQVTLTREGAKIFVALGDSGEMLRISLDRGDVDIWQAHGPALDDPDIRYSSGLVHEVRLSVDEKVLMTAGPDGWLQQWSTVTLTRAAAPIAVSWTNANQNIYATGYSFAPSVSSPDGKLLFTLDQAGASVVRRACDGEILATLEVPDNFAFPSWQEPFSPVKAAWSPSGEQLSVRFEGVVALWEVSRADE